MSGTDSSRPYVSYGIFGSGLASVREHGTTDALTAETLGIRRKYFGSVCLAYRQFGLLGADGEPTADLKAIAQGDLETTRQVLRERALVLYPDVFALPPEATSRDMWRVFWSIAPSQSNSTIQRSCAFFVDLAKDIRLPVNPEWTAPPAWARKRSPFAEGAPGAHGADDRGGDEQDAPPPPEASADDPVFDAGAGGGGTEEVFEDAEREHPTEDEDAFDQTSRDRRVNAGRYLRFALRAAETDQARRLLRAITTATLSGSGSITHTDRRVITTLAELLLEPDEVSV